MVKMSGRVDEKGSVGVNFFFQYIRLFLQLELCIKILSDIMDLLFKPEAGSTNNDVKEIILIILRTVIQTTIRMDRESSLVVRHY